MRAVVQRGPDELRLEELPDPDPGEGQVLVRLAANGICGSDLHYWHVSPPGPVVLGHEMAGVVVGDSAAGDVGAIGAIFGGDSCGTCDYCQAGLQHFCPHGVGLGSARAAGASGGLAEYVVVPAAHVLSATPGADPAVITLAEPLGNALRAFDRPETAEAGSAVVIGCGPLGLVHLAALRHVGIERIVAVESRPRRVAAALALGAEEVLAPGDDVADELRRRFPVGPDLVVEAVGLPATTHLATAIVRPRGTVHLMGVCTQPFRVNTLRWLFREVTVRTSIGTTAAEQRRALDLLSDGSIDLSAMITARIGLAEVPEAFEALAAGADEIKVVVEHDRDR